MIRARRPIAARRRIRALQSILASAAVSWPSGTFFRLPYFRNRGIVVITARLHSEVDCRASLVVSVRPAVRRRGAARALVQLRRDSRTAGGRPRQPARPGPRRRATGAVALAGRRDIRLPISRGEPLDRGGIEHPGKAVRARRDRDRRAVEVDGTDGRLSSRSASSSNAHWRHSSRRRYVAQAFRPL